MSNQSKPTVAGRRKDPYPPVLKQSPDKIVGGTRITDGKKSADRKKSGKDTDIELGWDIRMPDGRYLFYETKKDGYHRRGPFDNHAELMKFVSTVEGVEMTRRSPGKPPAAIAKKPAKKPAKKSPAGKPEAKKPATKPTKKTAKKPAKKPATKSPAKKEATKKK